MPTYRAILFDLDDTLYDFRTFWMNRLHVAVDEVCERLPDLDSQALVDAAIGDWVLSEQWPDFLRRNGVTDEAVLATRPAAFGANWFDEAMLSDDTKQILATLHARYKVGLITNGPAHIQRHKIERFGLADWMDVIVVSGEFGIAKPDPAIFAHALAQLQVAPTEALFVGDSIEYDYQGARAAGMPFVWFNRHQEPRPSDVPASLDTITHLEALLPYLEERAC